MVYRLLVGRSHRRTKTPHDIKGLMVLGNVDCLLTSSVAFIMTYFPLRAVHQILRLLALGAEVERNNDGIDGHEVLADLVGASHKSEHTGQHKGHEGLLTDSRFASFFLMISIRTSPFYFGEFSDSFSIFTINSLIGTLSKGLYSKNLKSFTKLTIDH